MHGHGAMPSERLQRPGVGAEGALGHHVGSPGGGMGAVRLRGDAGGTHLSRPPAPKQGCTALHTKPRRARGACSVSAHCIRSLARQRAVHESHSQHAAKNSSLLSARAETHRAFPSRERAAQPSRESAAVLRGGDPRHSPADGAPQPRPRHLPSPGTALRRPPPIPVRTRSSTAALRGDVGRRREGRDGARAGGGAFGATANAREAWLRGGAI